MTDLLDTVESFGVFIYLNAADDLNAYSVEDVEDNFDFKYLKDIDVEVFANNLISAVKAAQRQSRVYHGRARSRSLGKTSQSPDSQIQVG